MTEHVIQTSGLTKQYGKFTAVSSLDLNIKKGEVYGLLGPNGSGKTTTILMLLGLTEPTKGQLSVLGLDPVRQPLQVKARVGYLPDEVGFYDNLTARENLIYIAKLNGLTPGEYNKRIDEALARVGLSDVADNRVKTFSRGMRQRLGVAELLLKQPEIIIMDEPTLGLDPEAAHEFLQTILELKKEGITILLSSHLLHQVQTVCDRVGLFRHGKKVLEGTVAELAKKVLGQTHRIMLTVASPPDNLSTLLQNLPGVVSVKQPAPNEFVLEATTDLRADAAKTVIEAGGKLLKLDVEQVNLDTIYTSYFKKKDEEGKHDNHRQPAPALA
ncbi:MAG: ABC transporter ATP-binding protein [Candidatus Thermofonsia bacterium]|nr:MAG: ABC transporter ATP-binding protein [Candidatus Thermofonsia bacterium]